MSYTISRDALERQLRTAHREIARQRDRIAELEVELEDARATANVRAGQIAYLRRTQSDGLAPTE